MNLQKTLTFKINAKDKDFTFNMPSEDITWADSYDACFKILQEIYRINEQALKAKEALDKKESQAEPEAE